MNPSLEEFKALASKGNVIPVFQELLADMETPVSVFSRFMDREHCFLLESVEGGKRWGRYSLIGVDPYAVFEMKEKNVSIKRNGVDLVKGQQGRPLDILRDYLKTKKPVAVPGLPRFFGGAVGYLSYEAVREFERMPEPKTAAEWPDASFMISDQMIIFDNVRHTMKVLVCVHTDEFESMDAAYEYGVSGVKGLLSLLGKKVPTVYLPKERIDVELKSNMTKAQFEGAVERAKQYIVDGDIIQAVLSQRFSTELPVSPLLVYRALRVINPSPYMFCLKFGHRLLIGSSPEVMVRLTDDKVELRPIAGTRHRGKTEQEDRQLTDDLLKDEKERAEHVMLVDLGRNDLGRIGEPGSVQVKDFMTVERYSHVMHIVSQVEAIRKKDADAFDILAATFPAGTLSGAPKIRAMEIIHELEPERRGPYGGAVGYIGYDGNMDMAITIRTLQITGDQLSIQAGAGIVYDSDPEKEYEETCHKARAVVRSLEAAAAGLDPSILEQDLIGGAE